LFDSVVSSAQRYSVSQIDSVHTYATDVEEVLSVVLADSADWFDYESLSSESSRGKLEHAFQLAYERLNVDKLLDWQGLSTRLYSVVQWNV